MPRTSIVRHIALGWLALFLTGPRVDAAPQLVCYNVQPGDTSASLAFKLTNDSGSDNQPWFQVFDPRAVRWIPKTAYARLEPGWRACVEAARFKQGRPSIGTPPLRAVMPRAAGPTTGQRLGAIVRAMGWWWFPFVMSATALMWTFVDAYDERRRKTQRDLEHFGKTFVAEFERPLVEPSTAEPPVRSRLNVLPHRQRLEIFLAPGEGRRYPNLSDHRKNVEYDVERVVSALADPRFMPGELAARGTWVVVPFRLETGLRKAGWP